MPDLEAAWRTFKNPVPHHFRRHVLCLFRNTRAICNSHLSAERDERAMRMGSFRLVIRCPCLVAPYCTSSLEVMTVRFVTDVLYESCTLTQRLALPAQLRNSCWRSLLEKKRSSTKSGRSHQIRSEQFRLGTNHRLPQDSFLRCLSSLRKGKRSLPWPECMVDTLVTMVQIESQQMLTVPYTSVRYEGS